jgi:hypothetical protein
MTRSELQMVADHMGHDVNIHCNVYCLQQSTIEKAKVAKILLAIENGMLGKFRGKSLQDINADGKCIILSVYILIKVVVNHHRALLQLDMIGI